MYIALSLILDTFRRVRWSEEEDMELEDYKEQNKQITETDKVLLKSCFRLMAHLPEVSATLSGSWSKRGWVVNHRCNR